MLRHLPFMILLLTGVGCFNPADLAKRKDDPAVEQNAAADPGMEAADEAPAADVPANGAAPPAQPPVDFEKLSWRLVDKQKAMEENPKLVVKNTAKLGGQASDYLTAVSQAYVSARTRIYVMALQHELDLQKALNDDKWPTFEQFNQTLKQSQVQLENVYPWEIYAYDSQAGEILLLEDPDLRRKMRQERGLPVD